MTGRIVSGSGNLRQRGTVAGTFPTTARSLKPARGTERRVLPLLLPLLALPGGAT